MADEVDSYTLLTHVARVTCPPAARATLARVAERLGDWDEIPARAEHHGLAPLLYTHLRAAEVDVPQPVMRQLQALVVRHRHANRVRMEALAEILSALEAAGMAPLVLKGGALAHLLYPRPGLRPMRDLDILVRRDETEHARETVSQLTGAVPAQHNGHGEADHLIAGLERDGLHVSVEIHYALYGVERQEIERVIPFVLGNDGSTAHTLGYEEMMWHLCRHAMGHTNVFEAIRLIWVADVVGFAERFVDQIDWARIERDLPVARNALAIFSTITPLSMELRRAVQLPEPGPPLDLDFHGWPRTSLAMQRREKGLTHTLRDTLFPPEGWLRLRYGLGPDTPLVWHRWIHHPGHILGHVAKLALNH